MKKIVVILLVAIGFVACKSDDEGNADPGVGVVNFEFKNNIDNNAIVLNTGSYTNQSNETYSIAELKYIISNVVLINESGEEFKYPVDQSYFLINEEISESKSIALADIPGAKYTKIRFGFGVDQSKYPIESGSANFIPTAEEQGMLWNWSAGYKFLKYEGSFTPQGGTATDFLIHVGSHGDNLDNYKEITLDLSSPIDVKNGNSSTVTIATDVAKIFDSINTHSLADKSDIQVDPVNAPMIAANVQTMFTIQN